MPNAYVLLIVCVFKSQEEQKDSSVPLGSCFGIEIENALFHFVHAPISSL